MTTFDRREEAFENRFAHDEEMRFRAHARRDRKLGLWAAALMSRTGADAAAYADRLVAAQVGNGSDDAVVARLVHDLAEAGVPRSDHQIRREMDQLLAEAQVELQAE